jgi:hypothetical protein
MWTHEFKENSMKVFSQQADALDKDSLLHVG